MDLWKTIIGVGGLSHEEGNNMWALFALGSAVFAALTLYWLK